MNSRNLWFIAFVLMVVVQLFVPAKMIWEKELVLDKGTEFMFRTAPVDPSDPFRGKYLVLRFEDNLVEVEDISDWQEDEDVYLSLSKDSEGFAIPVAVSKIKPSSSEDFLVAKVDQLNSPNQVMIAYPFDRFYMEESKAYRAELLYRESMEDSSKVTFASVYVRKGNAVLQDILVNGKPLLDLLEEEQKKS